MSTGVGYQIWWRRANCDKKITFQDEGSNTTNCGISPQEYRQARLINDAIEGLPRDRRRVKKANDHYRDYAYYERNIREYDQLGENDSKRILFKGS